MFSSQNYSKKSAVAKESTQPLLTRSITVKGMNKSKWLCALMKEHLGQQYLSQKITAMVKHVPRKV